MVQSFFQQNLYRADAASELENDAKLALHIALYLLSSQESRNGAWPGQHIGMTLRNTCHALEALHLLGRDIAGEAIEAGLGWLINLPDLYEVASEEADLIRLYPSRFKTLAWLGEFTNPQVKQDFEELTDYLDDAGVLQGIMPKPLLATMVYVDCLDHLAALIGPLPASAHEQHCRALDYIYQQVLLWHQSHRQKTRYPAMVTVGDLSYALDLLLRAQRLSPPSEISQDIFGHLLNALAYPDKSRSTPADILYCGIQLAIHFPDVSQARTVIHNLVAYLRHKYEQLDLKKETLAFHPLALRVLQAYHGPQLKAEIIRQLLKQQQRHLETRQQGQEATLKGDLKTLLKERVEVDITEIQPLTGGITRAEIFRVHFALKLTSIGEAQERHTETYRPNPSSLVIKCSSLDSLRQAIRRYRHLPAPVKIYFAKYVGDPQTLQSGPNARSYLVMEDLTYMSTFRDTLARLDVGALSNSQKTELSQACAAICNDLFAIYNQTKRSESDFFGPQLARLYLSGLEKNLIRMCRADKFPHLKTWLRGFWLGERKYASIDHYLHKIDSHKARLKVPHLMLIHGDCHSRNLMLDAQLQHLKLIDLDNLDYDGDYIQDLALLLEDVAIFRFLFDERYRFHLEKSQIHFVSSTAEPAIIENKIEYRPFSGEAVRLVQQHILARLDTFARLLPDETWKERLWLALAASLIYLVSKQTEEEYATVLYVEAVKLLDDLTAYLDRGIPLEEIPFPGKHPTGVRRKLAIGLPTVPAWYQDDLILTHLHNGIMAFDAGLKYELTSGGRVVQYFIAGGLQPFAVIDGKKQPPALLLAGSPQTLDDPVGLTHPRQTDSTLRIIMPVSEQVETAAVLRLIRQAFEMSRSSP